MILNRRRLPLQAWLHAAWAARRQSPPYQPPEKGADHQGT